MKEKEKEEEEEKQKQKVRFLEGEAELNSISRR